MKQSQLARAPAVQGDLFFWNYNDTYSAAHYFSSQEPIADVSGQYAGTCDGLSASVVCECLRRILITILVDLSQISSERIWFTYCFCVIEPIVKSILC